MISRMEVEQDRFLDIAWNKLSAEEKQLMTDEELQKMIQKAETDAFDHLYADQLKVTIEMVLQRDADCRSRFDERRKGEQQ